jgi:hypothetical protein
MPQLTKTGTTSSLSHVAICIAALFSVVGVLASPAPLAILASGLCLGLIIRLLWNADEPPILLLPALFQWSEVSTPGVSTLWKRVPLNDLSNYNLDLTPVAIYGLVAVAMLTIGLRLGSGRPKRRSFAKQLQLEAMAWQYRDLAPIAFGAIGLGYLFALIATVAGPARQFFGEIANVKYVGMFALIYWCLIRRSHRLVLAALMFFEVVSGMTGFFAEFKYSILTFLVAALAARPKLRLADIGWASTASALVLSVGIFWSAVKPSYRVFVNHGTGAMVVLEPLEDRLRFLANAALEMDGAKFSYGFDRLVARHSYIEYLALTMDRVPAVTPYENGQLTLALLQHISAPRILFPDKPPLPNDSEVTAKYTGLSLDLSGNSSISIGYLGELYVDFGPLGALVAVGFVGLLAGLAYRKIRDHGRGPVLLVAGLCMMSLLPLAYFGQAYAKTIGDAVFCTIIAFVILHAFLPLVFKSSRGAAIRTLRFQRPEIVGATGQQRMPI